MVGSMTSSEKKKSDVKYLRRSTPVKVHVNNEALVSHSNKKGITKQLTSEQKTQKSKSATVPKSRKQRINSSGTRISGARTKIAERHIKENVSVSPQLAKSGDQRVAWESPTHKLEVYATRSTEGNEAPEDSEGHHHNMKNYEAKIDTLMDELGTLKNEVELQRTLRELDKREEELDISRVSLKEQHHGILVMKEDLFDTDHENHKLRHELDKVELDAYDTRLDRDRMSVERGRLKQKLIEVEMDGKAAVHQLYELRDVIRQLQNENTSNSAIRRHLTDAKGDLLDKLSEFEKTNQSLRHLLQQQNVQEMDKDRQREQVEVLLHKISEYENRCQRLGVDVMDKERSINELQTHVQGQMTENLQMSNVIKSLESVKAHLQKQLKMRESDCGRLNVQITVLENKLSEVKGQKTTIYRMTDKINDEIDEKEALKKACRLYKQKGEKAEDCLACVTNKLSECEQKLVHSDALTIQQRNQIDCLTKQIDDVEMAYTKAQDVAQLQISDLRGQINAKDGQTILMRSDQAELSTEVQCLRASLAQYETLVKDYKSEIERTRQEAEVTVVQLEHEQIQSQQIQRDTQLEVQELKGRLQLRLHELEPLPAMLETTEKKLQSNQTRLVAYEQRNHENTSLIADLSTKLELQHEELKNSKEKVKSTQDQHRQLLHQSDSSERRVVDMENHNRELTLLLSQRDQSLLSLNTRVDELNRDNKSLTVQVETTLTDMRHQADLLRDKTACRERTTQSRISDVERENVDLKTENVRLRREKEETDHQLTSRVHDLNDRLEQSYGTNRSMQNYVNFLKQSYGNVFGDVYTTDPASATHTF